MHAVPVVLKVIVLKDAHTDLCSSYTSYQKPIIQLVRIFIFFQNIFIDPIVSARKKAEKRDRHEEREKERKRRFGVNAIISVSSKELFSSLKIHFLSLILFSQPAKIIGLSLAQDEQEKLLKI